MSEYLKRAEDFLSRSSASIKIEFIGQMINHDWKEKEKRNAYDITIKTPRGEMQFTFWDSLHNTEISSMNLPTFARKYPKYQYEWNYAHRAKLEKMLKEAKANAKPTVYDILACLTKYDPGTFEEFCADFGYDDDSISAHKTYIAVMREFKQLERLFTPEQMEELADIN